MEKYKLIEQANNRALTDFYNLQYIPQPFDFPLSILNYISHLLDTTIKPYEHNR